MKIVFSFCLLVLSLTLMAQKKNVQSDSILVVGEIDSVLVITLASIAKYEAVEIPELSISNHKGDARGTAKALKGILVKDLLKEMRFKEDNSRLLSEFYFVFEAADGYKVVYSWNEIFNSATGDNLFLITSKDGETLENMPQRLLIMTTTDFKTGRRYIKGLAKIRVERIK